MTTLNKTIYAVAAGSISIIVSVAAFMHVQNRQDIVDLYEKASDKQQRIATLEQKVISIEGEKIGEKLNNLAVTIARLTVTVELLAEQMKKGK